MKQIILVLIGAAAGAFFSGLITWLIQKHQRKATEDWASLLKLTQVLASIFNPYVPQSINTEELEMHWGLIVAENYDLGSFQDIFVSLDHIVKNYISQMKEYRNRKISHEELEKLRKKASTKIQKMLEKHTNKGKVLFK